MLVGLRRVESPEGWGLGCAEEAIVLRELLQSLLDWREESSPVGQSAVARLGLECGIGLQLVLVELGLVERSLPEELPPLRAAEL